MELSFFKVDAFTDHIFGGNPAVVIELENWLPKDLMLSIAKENGVAETAFFIKDKNRFLLRWFTPEIEMDLCGHATLSTAHVIFEHLNRHFDKICFSTVAGILNVHKVGDQLSLELPIRVAKKIILPKGIAESLSKLPLEVYKARDYLLVYESEADIVAIDIDKFKLDRINMDPGGIIITAPGSEVDFVSRFFTPQASIFEDPVTGSAHSSLIPYWAERLNLKNLTAKQLSSRGGYLECRLEKERVHIKGKAITFMKGTLFIEN